MRSIAAVLCVVVGAAGLSACGFHLRGPQQLPPQMDKMFIRTQNPGSDLVVYLKRFLKDASVELLHYPAEDTAVLRVQESSGRRPLSVGLDGKALEYEIYYRANFSVDMPGEVDFPQREIVLTREYVYDRFGVLAVNEEEALLKQDMQRELARMIVEQMAAYDWPAAVNPQ